MSGGSILKKTAEAIRVSGLRPGRRMGQNYVVDEKLISCLLETARLTGAETVLEIGAGTGNLTEPLAARAKRVIAVEKDLAAAGYLEGRVSPLGNVEVVRGDILSMELPRADRIVSNLPYSVSTPITFKVLAEGRFSLAALTYQKEVAARLVAQPGSPEYSRLSVMAALMASVRRVRDFPPESFYPRPRVGSTVVVMERLGPAQVDMPSLEETLKALFSQRRRVLRKALEAYSKIRSVDRGRATEVVPTPLLGKRVFEITPPEFLELNRCLDAAARTRPGGGQDRA